jgi:PAS domain S-box-containing protein
MLSIYTFLIFLIFIVASVSIYNLYSLNKSIDGLIAANYRSIISAKNMIDAIERQDSYELLFIQVEYETGVKEFYDNQIEFITWLTKSRDNITENRERDIIEYITNSYNQYTDKFLKLLKIKNSTGEAEAVKYYSEEIYPIFLIIKDSCQELVTLNEEAMFSSKDRATIFSRNQTYATTILSICTIIIGLAFAIYFTRKTVQPIHILIAGIKSIKEGNLNQEIEVSTKDEIGELALEFNNMTKRLSIYEKSNIKSIILERNKSLAIVKSIEDPIIVTDNDYKIILVNKNAEKVFNINERNAIGRHFLESINNGEIFNKIKASMDKNYDEEKDRIISIEEEDKVHYYIIAVTSILSNDNEIYGTVTVLQDITGLKEIEQMKSDFVSTVSHELRTPLTSIIMGTELLLDNTAGELNHEQREVVNAVDEESKQLVALVNDLLDLSKIESGKIQMHYESISIDNIIKSVVNSINEIAEGRGIKILSNVSSNIPNINADYNKILSVITNLVTNAMKFTAQGDEIKIIAELEEKLIRVCVSDTGIGIPKQYHNTIFDKFTQLQQSSYNVGGTGLGLSIAKEYIIMHGGEIWVESEQGEGSNFIFTLPLNSAL